MKNKIISISLIISILISVFMGTLTYRKNSKDLNMINQTTNTKYDTLEDVERALNSVNEQNKATILTDVDTSQKIIPLVFEEFNNDDTLIKTLDLLKKYKMKATFFVSGINSAENPEILKKIILEGHEIGSATLYNNKNMNSLSQEELIRNLCTTNKIIESAIGKKKQNC